MLSVICFSKDRPLQLEAYLESLIYYSGVKPQFITCLTATSLGISYDRIIAQHPGINWVHETQFGDDLLRAVRMSENFILFGCDDVVFKEYFDLNDCISILQRNPDVFGFSLRLGGNINFLPRVDESDGVLTWHWREARGEYWRYPWEVSASIYRKNVALNLLESRTDITNPNRFEAFLASDIASGKFEAAPRLACFATSTCATVTVNRVQDEYQNVFDASKSTSPEELYCCHVDGLKQDWVKLAHWRNGSVHVGAEAFALVRIVNAPPLNYIMASTGVGILAKRNGNLALKIFCWRIMTNLWEAARKRLPRPILNLVRVAARKAASLRR
ncbi:hypothetical protein IYW40_00200 [Methylocystis sp. H4A]|uniref:hypothetical protein n=1 Tax=Methylocystis sp. H4A TaxID=2785788 RepID=UPI0018C28FEF|nr:hypothetical protein [Methylocystis sp. H4A]MBG0799958.1 hypothetical protein [Methylocystis sp. H4A]